MENFRVNLEEFKVLGKELVDKVQEMIHEGNIRRIIIRDDHGHTFMEIPLTVAAIGAVLAPVLAAVGAIAAPGALHHRRGARPAAARRRTSRAASAHRKPTSEPRSEPWQATTRISAASSRS
jgi:hypothetical protein